MQVIRIPVNVHLVTLVSGTRRITPEWSTTTIQTAVAGANRIWDPAKICLVVRSTSADHVTLPGGGAPTAVDRSGFFYIGGQFGRRTEVALALVRAVTDRDLGGAAVAQMRFTLLPWSPNAAYRAGVLAHEIGHLLSLPHVEVRRGPGQSGAAIAAAMRNLMHPGLRSGNELTAGQIQAARGSALARGTPPPRARR